MLERVKSLPRLLSSSLSKWVLYVQTFHLSSTKWFPISFSQFRRSLYFYFISDCLLLSLLISCTIPNSVHRGGKTRNKPHASWKKLRNMPLKPFFHLSSRSFCLGHKLLHTPVSHLVLRCFQASSRRVLGSQNGLKCFMDFCHLFFYQRGAEQKIFTTPS